MQRAKHLNTNHRISCLQGVNALHKGEEMDNFIYHSTNPTTGGVTCQNTSFWHPIPKAIPKKMARKKTAKKQFLSSPFFSSIL